MRYPGLDAPPLDGFDLCPVPTVRLPFIACDLDKLAKAQSKGWPLLAAKCRDRAEELRTQWRQRVASSEVRP